MFRRTLGIKEYSSISLNYASNLEEFLRFHEVFSDMDNEYLRLMKTDMKGFENRSNRDRGLER